MPAYFEPNVGQFAPQVRFLARTARYRAWITDRELVLQAAKQQPIRIQFGPSHSTPLKSEGLDKQPGTSAYYRGNDPSKWISGVPAYTKAKLHDVYPGIDVLFYERDGAIEYDLIVNPGADASQISIHFDPRTKPRQGPRGEITMDLPAGGKLRHEIPSVHQQSTSVAFKPRFDGHTLRFELARYNIDEPLIIDPTLVYSSYLGGAGLETGIAIATDAAGAMYVTGVTTGLDFPDPSTADMGEEDLFVVKLSAIPIAGVHQRVFTAHLGGIRGDFPTGIAVDAAGSAYVGGYTTSANFPVKQAFQPVPQIAATPDGFLSPDGFLLKVNEQGLVYSTFVGGSGYDAINGVSVDATGTAYVAGNTRSPNLPTRNAYQSTPGTNGDIFVMKLAATPTAGSGIYEPLYVTYVGGFGADSAAGVASDSTGAAYVVGTSDGGMPVKAAVRPTLNGTKNDIFVLKIGSSTGADGRYDLVYCTYLGGPDYDFANGIAVDQQGNAFVLGYTLGTEFPLVRAPLTRGSRIAVKLAAQPTNGVYDIVYSTFLPGRSASAIAIDLTGAAYITGNESGYGVIDQEPGVGNPAMPYVTKISAAPGPTNFAILYHVRVGAASGSEVRGIAVDPAGAVYVVGSISNTSLTIYNGGPFAGAQDAFIQKLTGGAVTPPRVLISSQSIDGNISFNVTGGAGCDAGTFLTPKYFDWAPGVSCTVTMAGVFPHPALQGSQYQFAKWADTGVASVTRVVQAAAQPQVFDAGFDLYHHLVTQVAGPAGSGAVDPVVDQFYKDGTKISLTATPRAGYGFRGWLGVNSAAPSPLLTVRNSVTAVAQFEPLTVNPAALQFFPLQPRRVFDSRVMTGLGPLNHDSRLRVPVAVGYNAIAVSVNLTVVPRGPLGYLSVWSGDAVQPLVSTLNSLDGRIKANAAIIPVDADGSINVYATDETDLIIDLNGYFVPPQTGSLAFYPLPPCRIADTRLATGPLGGPALDAKAARTLPVRSSACNIPATAQAYSLNATVVPGRPLGFLTLWPTGVEQPVVSTLNDLTGTIVANAAIVPAGTNGSIDVYATDQTQLVLDINGYFAPPGQTGALNFQLTPPCRVLDTRDAAGTFGGPALAPGLARDFAVPASACGIPAAARAYSVNATVVPPALFGFLTLWPAGSTQPVVSTLNAVDAALTSNAALVPAGANGAMSVFASDLVHLLVDINGYFKP